MSKKTKVELKNEELTFGVAEAVEVLLVQYLANVEVKVDQAATAVTAAYEARDERIDSIKESTDVSKYNHISEILGISSRVAGVEVLVGDTLADSSIRVVLKLTDTDIVADNYHPEMGKYRVLPLRSKDYDKLVTRNKAIDAAEGALAAVETLQYTQCVERTLRARVMRVKLQEAGVDITALLADGEIAAIVNV